MDQVTEATLSERKRRAAASSNEPSHVNDAIPAAVTSGFAQRRPSTTRATLSQSAVQTMMPAIGLEAAYLENRDRLLRLLVARGAGDAAEDLAQELWLKVSARPDETIANPMAYLFKAADLLMIDRYRSRRQAEMRDRAWEELRQEAHAGFGWQQEREIAARQEAERVAEALRTLGPRKETIFRRVRIEGLPQQQVADEFGISISTVESDLRQAARVLARLREELR